MHILCWSFFFFFNDTATTEIYTSLHTLSLHDALPISPDLVGDDAERPRGGCHGDAVVPRARVRLVGGLCRDTGRGRLDARSRRVGDAREWQRSEEHTSELQSLMRISYAVFCLKKKKMYIRHRENS